MSMLAYSLVVGAGVASLITAVTCLVVKNNSWDLALALVSSLIVLTVLALAPVRLDPEEDVANGLALYAGLIQAFFFWIVAAATVLIVHPLVRRFRP